MARLLALYGTTHGQTAKIIEHIAALLRTRGHDVSLLRADAVSAGWPLPPCDGVIVAASVYFGKHQRAVRDVVRAHRIELAAHPAAFVSVCGSLAPGWAEGPAEARKYIEQFLTDTGWKPKETASFAGAVKYRAYRWPIRMVMKLISFRTGRPTDTSRDWEFTDWDAVDRFANAFAGEFEPMRVPALA